MKTSICILRSFVPFLVLLQLLIQSTRGCRRLLLVLLLLKAFLVINRLVRGVGVVSSEFYERRSWCLVLSKQVVGVHIRRRGASPCADEAVSQSKGHRGEDDRDDGSQGQEGKEEGRT